MRLLMLGGTEFVGRAVTEDALARGWDVTVFHRGRHAGPDGGRGGPRGRTKAAGGAGRPPPAGPGGGARERVGGRPSERAGGV
ncbi:reductase, partial [Streptomyces lasiicapitis]